MKGRFQGQHLLLQLLEQMNESAKTAAKYSIVADADVAVQMFPVSATDASVSVHVEMSVTHLWTVKRLFSVAATCWSSIIYSKECDRSPSAGGRNSSVKFSNIFTQRNSVADFI